MSEVWVNVGFDALASGVTTGGETLATARADALRAYDEVAAGSWRCPWAVVTP